MKSNAPSRSLSRLVKAHTKLPILAAYPCLTVISISVARCQIRICSIASLVWALNKGANIPSAILSEFFYINKPYIDLVMPFEARGSGNYASSCSCFSAEVRADAGPMHSNPRNRKFAQCCWAVWSFKGVFITTQLNSTELNSTAWTTVDSVCRSWRHKQKHDWLGCTLFNWVSWVQLSCVAINTP